MSIPEEVALELELVQKGLIDKVRFAQLRKSLKFDDDGNLQHISEDGKFVTLIGEVTGGEVHIGDRFVIGLDDLQDFINPPEINWKEVSRTFLIQNTERLTTNPLTHCEGITHKTKKVYVPLGLVEREKQSRRKDDVQPEHGSSLYEETEVTRKFEHREFISKVLVEGDSPKSKGRRISIIGEPGAGKTTSLQQISNWIANNVDGAIVIWIPLADLQGRSIEEYIFEHWLQSVTRISGYAEVSRLIKNEFVSLFQQDNIWLMLDGVDEISGLFRNPLNELGSQLTGTLLSQARVLLTCRLNLWDENRHPLDNFDIYRTLEFSYPVQVEGFIDNWFTLRAKSTLARSLCAALDDPKARRIQDLVKNPLRLALLCFSWSLREGKLPATQAELYAQYVESIYDWKREKFPISNGQRRLLDTALSMLSCRAIDGADGHQNSRFRLRQELVEQHLNKPLPGSEGTILDLALKIGWINQVGVDANNPTQKIYAFYHTSFEEYFAALGIEEGSFFFSHLRWNISSRKNSYRLLEFQWKQVFILWLGRKDISTEKKNNLIGDLIGFKDGCRGFYSNKAFFIACKGINEFDSTHAEQIVQKLMKWRKGSLVGLVLLGESGERNKNKECREAIKQLRDSHSNSKLAIQYLTKDIQSKRTPWVVCDDDAVLLEAVDPGNEFAIQTLLNVTNHKSYNSFTYIRRDLASSLGQLSSPNQQVVSILCELLLTEEEETQTRVEAAESLGKIAIGNQLAIESLVQALSVSLKYAASMHNLHSYTEHTRACTKYAEVLSKISVENKSSIEALSSLVWVCRDRDFHLPHLPRTLLDSLMMVGADSRVTTDTLVNLMNYKLERITLSTVFFEIRTIIIFLGRLAVTDEDTVLSVVRALEILSVSNLQRYFKEKLRDNIRIAIETLRNIGCNSKIAIKALIQLIESSNDKEIREMAVTALKKIGDKESILQIAPHSEFLVREHSLSKIVEKLYETILRDEERALKRGSKGPVLGRALSLHELDPTGKLSEREMLDIIESTDEKSVKEEAVRILTVFVNSKSPSIHKLILFLRTSKDEETFSIIAEKLLEVCPGNHAVTEALLNRASYAGSNECILAAIGFLGKIKSKSSIIVSTLSEIIKNSADEMIRYTAADTIGKLDPENRLAFQELIELIKSTDMDIYIRVDAITSLCRFKIGKEIAIKSLIEVIEGCNSETKKNGSFEDAVEETLSNIAVGNVFAINELVRLMIENEGNSSWDLSPILENICNSDNEIIILKLLNEIEANRNEEVIEVMAKALETSGKKNKKVLVELVRILGESRKNGMDRIYSDYHESIAKTLEKIGIEDINMIELLVSELRRFRWHSEAYELLLSCANKMKYEKFRRAFRRGRWNQIVSATNPRTWRLFTQRMKGWYKELIA